MEVKGLLVDVTGVLYNSKPGSDGSAIPNSAEAVRRIYESTTSNVKFISNSKRNSNENIVRKLRRLGIHVRPEDVFTPAPVCAEYVRNHELRPYLVIGSELYQYFEDIPTEDPNCVVLGVVEKDFSYENLNKAFRVLMGMKKPLLITVGFGKFYQQEDGLSLDIGAFAAALQFATNCSVVNIGKPSQEYYERAVESMGLEKNQVVMIGDDIITDVGGAQAAGIRAVLVKTGKWRPEWEHHVIKPDLISDNLLTALKTIQSNGFRM